MFRSRTVDPERRPTLSREKVVLIYDEKEKTEHFIREIAFAKADEAFGFVVPVPSKPTLSKVEDQDAFTYLRKYFPYETGLGRIGHGSGTGSGYGTGSGAGFGRGGVKVEEVRRVGSFKAYILSATDEEDLAAWLAENRFVASKGGEAWLRHYVQLGFYYVAMRYEPPRGKTRGQSDAKHPIDAETVRISFQTPVPYYPYLEPAEPKLDRNSPRLLEVWYVGSKPVVPVGVQERDGTKEWVRPLRHGHTYDDPRTDVVNASKELEEFLPKGELVLQTFQDQKRSRSGFGDVLFVPADGATLTAERTRELEPMLAVLDPGLLAVPESEGKEGAK